MVRETEYIRVRRNLPETALWEYVEAAEAQSNTIKLVTSSINGGGGEMSGGAASLESSVGQSEPVGSSSSASFSLESGFIPVIAEQCPLDPVVPVATPISIPNIWDALSMCPAEDWRHS